MRGNDALLNPGLRRPWREDMQTEDLSLTTSATATLSLFRIFGTGDIFFLVVGGEASFNQFQQSIYRNLARVSRKKVALLLDFVQMRGWRALPKFFVAFS